MANHISHSALPFPVKGCRYTILVPYLDADGDPTDPTTPDTERSIDAAAFADCTEEVTTISGTNGTGYITLTGDEMNGSAIAVAAKVASGPKATLATLYPRVLPVIFSGTATAGAAGTITLSATTPPATDKLIVGCIIRTTGGTGGAGGSGSQGNQARVITDYVASTRVVTVSPNWETNPDNTTTYEVLLTESALIRHADVRVIEGVVLDTHDAGSIPSDVRTWNGTAPNNLISGRVDSNPGAIQANVITATAINADAITAPKIADGAIDAATFAAGAIDAAAIATDAIGSAELAASAVTEIQSGLATATALATVQSDTDDIQSRLPAALVSGRMDSSIGSVPSAIERQLKFEIVLTADSGSTTTTIVDSALSGYGDDYWNGAWVVMLSGNANHLARQVTDYTSSTGTLTVAPAFPAAVAAGDSYGILPKARQDVGLWNEAALNDLISGRVDASAGALASSVVTATSIASDAITAAKIAAGAIDAATMAADTNFYHAKVWIIDDNSGTTDRYVVVWYKNGVPQTSGITSPTIQVYKVSDGSDLIASTAMTQIASTGTYKYDATSTARIASGAAYMAIVTASIDSATRSWYQPVGRDS